MTVRSVLGRGTGAVAAAGVVALAGNGAAAGVASVSPGSEAAPSGTRAAEGRYLVRYVPGTDMAAAARALRARGVAVERTVTRALDAAAVTLTTTQVAALAGSPEVLSVQRDVRLTVAGTQPDPTWGLDRIDQRVLPLSASFTTPASATPVDAYVVDTGAAAHDDLAGRVRAGWSAVDTGPGNVDCNGHGTHVAATIAGSTYGVAKTAAVIPVRVLDCDGAGYLSDFVVGIDWVVGQHRAGAPAVANLSLGGAANTTIDAAVDALVADGIAVAVAAGNEDTDACTRSPARTPAAITVAATDSEDRQAVFTNAGPCVDLYAPGVDITSAWPSGQSATATISGTSMASPHVAGVAALLLSTQPGLSPGQVADRLTADATTGVVTGAGAGTPNRLLFLDQYAGLPAPPAPTPPAAAQLPPPPPVVVAATVPGKARSVQAAPRSRAARVTWIAGPDGGSPILAQRIRVYRAGDRVRALTVSAGADHARVQRLKPGVRYRFTVTLRNAVGRGPESARSGAVEPRR